MSLRTEQRFFLGWEFTELEPKIYSTGVYLVPMEVVKKGISKWVWVVDEFDDDTYYEGENISPNVLANTKNELFRE